MKKVVVSLGAIALSGLMASTAFASFVVNNGSQSSITTNQDNTTTTTVTNSNSAEVKNDVASTAQTGDNSITSGHGDVKNVGINTGDASSSSSVTNAVNGIDSTVNAPAC